MTFKTIPNVILKSMPTILSVAVSIGSAAYYLGIEVQDGFTAMKSELITEAREPTYLMMEYSLKKQREKLDKDPNDIKSTDVELATIECQSDFGQKYIPTLSPERRINAQQTCEKLADMYANKGSY